MQGRHSPLAATLIAAAWVGGCSDQQLMSPPASDQGQAPDVAASQAADTQDVIPGQYIVVFRNEVQNPVQLATNLVATHNGTLRHTYQHALKGFAAALPAAAVSALENNPQVAYVEQDAYSYVDTHPRYAEIMAGVTASAVATERKAALRMVVGFNGLATVAKPPLQPPSPLTATAVSSTEINVTWTDNSKGETGTELERSVDGGLWQQIADVPSGVTNHSDTDVTVGLEHCYRARVYKQKGNKPREYSNYSNTDCDTPAAPNPPNAPSNLVATAVSSSQIDLTWQDNSTDEDDFEIERCLGTVASCNDVDYSNVDTVGPNVTNYSDPGRAASTTYSYRVRATNSAGPSGYSNEDDATTFTPDPPDGDPTNLVATPAGTTQIDLTWDDNASNEDGYEIWRCDGDAATCDDAGQSNYSEIDQTGPFGGAGSYSDTGRSPDTDYSYLVRAFNADGVSAFSNEASARTDAPQPGQCNDNGVHDPQNDPGDYGITATQATYNDTWAGVRGNNPATCGIKAWFFGIDTGVDKDHPDLNVTQTVDFTGTNGTGEDDHGHGTHTAGTAAAIDGGPAGGIVGMAPGAEIFGFKVCTSGGSCPNSDIIAGVDEVTARKNANPAQPMVANMSLGGGASNSIDTSVRRSINAGVTYSLSAGNGVFGACFFPANAQNASPARTGDDDINAADGSDGDTKRVNGVLTTTSHNSSFNDVNCNFGNPVTIAAPGSGIRSTWLNGGYNTISGTSMAAPHSAGAAMLYLQDGTDDPTTVENALCQRTLPWTTNDLPNAEGRLNVDGLGTDPADAPNQPTATSTCA